MSSNENLHKFSLGIAFEITIRLISVNNNQNVGLFENGARRSVHGQWTMGHDHELSIIDGTLKSEQRILYEYRILNIFH